MILTLIIVFMGRTTPMNDFPGRIDFPGTDSYLIVETTEPGTAADAPDGTTTSSMTWHIASGGGKFKGAQGQITGNSQGTADGRFTDHQVYKIVLQGRS
jgi:hypothetical protein